MRREDESQGDLSVSSPGGWKARFTGADTKFLLSLIIFLACFGIAAYEWDQDRRTSAASRENFAGQHRLTQELLRQVLTTQDTIVVLYKENSAERRNDINEIAYILSLPQAKREQLRLEMPDGLRKKLNTR